MRRLLAALGLIGLVSSAFAADYDLPTLRGSGTYIPASPTYFRWEGFYAGGHLTYGNANADFSAATPPPIVFSLPGLVVAQQPQALGTDDAGTAGFGGFVGYNGQFDDAVVGLELNYTHSSFNTIGSSNPIESVSAAGGHNYDVISTGSGSMHLTDIATLRTRLGWAVDRYMPYATVGVAAGRADVALSATTSVTDAPTPPVPPVCTTPCVLTQSQSKNSALLFGLAVGGGLDIALTQGLFARAEYEHVQWSSYWKITSQLHMARVGLGWKF
jgi:outer membrane immunogenic protein